MWYVAFPFGPATAGLVEVASMSGTERRTECDVMRRVAARSIQRENYAAVGARRSAMNCTPLDTCSEWKGEC